MAEVDNEIRVRLEGSAGNEIYSILVQYITNLVCCFAVIKHLMNCNANLYMCLY